MASVFCTLSKPFSPITFLGKAKPHVNRFSSHSLLSFVCLGCVDWQMVGISLSYICLKYNGLYFVTNRESIYQRNSAFIIIIQDYTNKVDTRHLLHSVLLSLHLTEFNFHKAEIWKQKYDVLLLTSDIWASCFVLDCTWETSFYTTKYVAQEVTWHSKWSSKQKIQMKL